MDEYGLENYLFGKSRERGIINHLLRFVVDVSTERCSSDRLAYPVVTNLQRWFDDISPSERRVLIVEKLESLYNNFFNPDYNPKYNDLRTLSNLIIALELRKSQLRRGNRSATLIVYRDDLETKALNRAIKMAEDHNEYVYNQAYIPLVEWGLPPEIADMIAKKNVIVFKPIRKKACIRDDN